jgi:hypothetical protein
MHERTYQMTLMYLPNEKESEKCLGGNQIHVSYSVYLIL